jgi:cytochrome c biogenesis protein CcmG/thiol:disulfide interchange protein DsbE
MRHTIQVLAFVLGYTPLLTGCSCSNDGELNLAQAHAEAETAKREAAAAKAELGKLHAEVPGGQPATGKDEAKATEAGLRVGQPAPPLHVKTLLQAPADAPSTLDRLKGKAIVLEFWGTWCLPCIAAFPHLNELVKDTRDDPVVFIAVTDEPADRVAAFLEKKTLAAWVGIDDRGATTSGYGIRSWPTTVLIDPDGLVRGVTRPEAVSAAMLKDLVNRRPLKIAETDLLRPQKTKRGASI